MELEVQPTQRMHSDLVHLHCLAWATSILLQLSMIICVAV